MISVVEQTRLRVSKNTDAKMKSHLGQFFTPATTAHFMARLFPDSVKGVCRLLDPGAGIGSLSSAFLERWISGSFIFTNVEITAFEFDEILHGELTSTLASYSERLPLAYEIVGGDFVEKSVNKIQFGNDARFSHAILNPPYKKISSDSRHRLLLRQVEIETVNLYSAFVALTLSLMQPGGHIVAIIPRSFCNGPYYRPFRDIILKDAAIHHIHLFTSRNKAFKDDDVLQENIIILLECRGRQGNVTVTTSTDDSFDDLTTNSYPFARIVLPEDNERFIHIPTSPQLNAIELSSIIKYSLNDIGIKVSTGPVVDFRLKEHLRAMPDLGSVPLLYPCHFNGLKMEWPQTGIKKSNSIQCNSVTEKWLYPNGFYCVVKRFSSKEERRRIVASVVQPDVFGDVELLGFENHLNVFHESKHGLSESLARGLAVYLNTTAVDENFRRFSGHTQVNATDLKLMKYPSRENLISLGEKAKYLENDQQMIDQFFQELEEQ